jgi:hypothetical protein
LELPRAWEPSDSSGALPDSEVKDVYYGFLNGNQVMEGKNGFYSMQTRLYKHVRGG